MKITKVIFINVNDEIVLNSDLICQGDNYLATCDVVLDDCLVLSGISLYAKRNEIGYYLIFPSKQDIYRGISNLNGGVDIKYPPNLKRKNNYENNSKRFEEFYHPVEKSFYDTLLNTIIVGYNSCIVKGKKRSLSYKPV